MESILAFIFVLGLIVFIHELGHLLSAKAFGVYCKEFALGMGPKIYSIKGKETEYSVRLLPLGGFVSMVGEEGVEVDVPKERSLKGIHPLKRLVVMLAGIVMNILLAFVIMVGLHIHNGYVIQNPEPVLGEIVENSPADLAGLKVNDRIVEVQFSDGTMIQPKDFYDLVEVLQLYQNTMTFVVDRNRDLIHIEITPQLDEQRGYYVIGVMSPQAQVKEITVFEAFTYGAQDLVDMGASMLMTLSRLVRGIGLSAISGPVGIFQVTAQSAQMGILSLLYLAGLLSLNVALFNLIPLPLLDGGRAVLIFIEMIIGKPVNAKIEQALMLASMILLLILTLFVTSQDLFKLF